MMRNQTGAGGRSVVPEWRGPNGNAMPIAASFVKRAVLKQVPCKSQPCRHNRALQRPAVAESEDLMLDTAESQKSSRSASASGARPYLDPLFSYIWRNSRREQ